MLKPLFCAILKLLAQPNCVQCVLGCSIYWCCCSLFLPKLSSKLLVAHKKTTTTRWTNEQQKKKNDKNKHILRKTYLCNPIQYSACDENDDPIAFIRRLQFKNNTNNILLHFERINRRACSCHWTEPNRIERTVWNKTHSLSRTPALSHNCEIDQNIAIQLLNTSEIQMFS